MVVAAQHAAQIGAASRGATGQDPRQLSGHSLIDSSRPQASAHQGRLHAGPSHHPGTAQVTWLIKKSTEVHFSDPCLELFCSANCSGKAFRCFKRLYPFSADSTWNDPIQLSHKPVHKGLLKQQHLGEALTWETGSIHFPVRIPQTL